jgi:hypothetical protein
MFQINPLHHQVTIHIYTYFVEYVIAMYVFFYKTPVYKESDIYIYKFLTSMLHSGNKHF